MAVNLIVMENLTANFRGRCYIVTMANSLKCNLCDNPATIHLTQILNNKVHKVDLCEACAQAKGVTDPNGFSLADFFVKSIVEAEAMPGQVKCDVCGFTQDDFRKTGRLGCPSCYEAFEGLLEPALANMHKGTIHRGKIPTRVIERRSVQERVVILEEELRHAVIDERYEDAAKIRDQINQLKQGSVDRT